MDKKVDKPNNRILRYIFFSSLFIFSDVIFNNFIELTHLKSIFYYLIEISLWKIPGILFFTIYSSNIIQRLLKITKINNNKPPIDIVLYNLIFIYPFYIILLFSFGLRFIAHIFDIISNALFICHTECMVMNNFDYPIYSYFYNNKKRYLIFSLCYEIVISFLRSLDKNQFLLYLKNNIPNNIPNNILYNIPNNILNNLYMLDFKLIEVCYIFPFFIGLSVFIILRRSIRSNI